ncbi:hypothetical protein I317_00419 [Kwoniella heveanensis CBS 569]|nr:hypothetical protein I317_00419 [Kwoniella heveanensis CBS 569]
MTHPSRSRRIWSISLFLLFSLQVALGCTASTSGYSTRDTQAAKVVATPPPVPHVITYRQGSVPLPRQEEVAASGDDADQQSIESQISDDSPAEGNGKTPQDTSESPEPPPPTEEVVIETPTTTTEPAGDQDLGLPEAEGDGVETIIVTFTPIVTVWPDQGTQTETVTTSHRLNPAKTPIPLSDQMGLIMPSPWTDLYTELNYTFGFVDAVARPAPTAGGWLRVVQPLLIFPNYTVAVFPSFGTDDPTSVEAVPVGSDGLCGAAPGNWPFAFPFKFLVPGWYMFVVNQTFIQVNVTSSNQCTHPILQQESFFSTQTFSIAPRPTGQAPPLSPSSAFTVFAEVSTNLPGDLPIDPHAASKGEKLAIALGVAGALLGLALIVLIMWWVRKKRKMDREALAFSRLSQKDQEAFLRENPDSFLNPNHPRYTAKNGYSRNEPPAPPGTMAYAIWWSQQMWNNQLMMRQHPLGWNAYGAQGGAYQPTAQMSYMGGQPATAAAGTGVGGGGAGGGPVPVWSTRQPYTGGYTGQSGYGSASIPGPGYGTGGLYGQVYGYGR